MRLRMDCFGIATRACCKCATVDCGTGVFPDDAAHDFCNQSNVLLVTLNLKFRFPSRRAVNYVCDYVTVEDAAATLIPVSSKGTISSVTDTEVFPEF